MRDSNHGPCPACGNRSSPEYLYLPGVRGRLYPYARCAQCGLLFCDPPPSNAELDACYSEAYYGRGASKFPAYLNPLIDRLNRNRAVWVRGLTDRGAILDIGCGDGRFLKWMSSFGYEIHGTEREGPAQDRARRVPGIVLHPEEPDRWELPDDYLSTITVWHVLEHLKDPAGFLWRCTRKLRPGGMLVVEVPDRSSLQGRLFGRWWFHLDPPRHLFQFERTSLTALLQRSGYRVVKISSVTGLMGCYGAVQSLLNLAVRPRESLYDFIRTRGISDDNTVRAVLLSVLLLPVAVPLAGVINFLEVVLRRGAALRVAAEKV